MPSKPLTLMTSFVLDRIEQEPIQRQIELYEALAEVAATPAEAKSLRSLASDLKLVAHKHYQLVLDFKRSSL